jgi:hypothetical protein
MKVVHLALESQYFGRSAAQHLISWGKDGHSTPRQVSYPENFVQMVQSARRAKRISVALSAFAAAIFMSSEAWSAGAAYAVDTAEVSEAGSCKVESWISSAGNHDLFAAVAPACVVDFSRPVEVSVQLNRSRSDGEWTTGATPKLKTNLVPSGIGTWGVAVAAGASFDLITKENTGAFSYVPATLRLSENARINLNGGWQWDRIADRHYLLYGAGIDLRTSDNVWTLTGEVFGLAGASDATSVTQPRFQVGLRFRPVDRFNVDVIYGRNLTGENANWITLATVIRFPPPGK